MGCCVCIGDQLQKKSYGGSQSITQNLGLSMTQSALRAAPLLCVASKRERVYLAQACAHCYSSVGYFIKECEL